MKVIITSGGVKEKIDNVRNITNSSSGALGNKIAHCFLNSVPPKDIELFYIHASSVEPILKSKRVNNIPINSTQDLLDAVDKVLKENEIDIFIHCMAVADYTTSRVIDFNAFIKDIRANMSSNNFDVDDLLIKNTIGNNSKISSDIENPAIILKKTPKVIKRIKEISPYTFLVGFKLLDNVSEEELFDVGFDLLRKNRCNLVLANDIKHIREGNHTGLLIYPEKSYDVIKGKDNIAETLVSEAIRRSSVKHPKSIQIDKDNQITQDIYESFYETGKYLDNLGLLPKVINHNRIDKEGTYGNMSFREVSGYFKGFFITSRNVNKGNLSRNDISYIEDVEFISEDSIYSKVFYHSRLKPSIDTTIHSKIYDETEYNCIVHIHTDKVFLGIPFIEERFPCGCSEECTSIIRAIKIDEKEENLGIIQMRKHGIMIMGNSFDECKSKLENLLKNVPYIDYTTNEICIEAIEHIKKMNPSFIKQNSVFPIKINDEDIGVLYEETKDTTNYIDFGIFTVEKVKGKGLHIVDKYVKLYSGNYILHTTKECKIADFYEQRYGFKVLYSYDNKDLQYILRK